MINANIKTYTHQGIEINKREGGYFAIVFIQKSVDGSNRMAESIFSETFRTLTRAKDFAEKVAAGETRYEIANRPLVNSLY